MYDGIGKTKTEALPKSRQGFLEKLYCKFLSHNELLF